MRADDASIDRGAGRPSGGSGRFDELLMTDLKQPLDAWRTERADRLAAGIDSRTHPPLRRRIAGEDLIPNRRRRSVIRSNADRSPPAISAAVARGSVRRACSPYSSVL